MYRGGNIMIKKGYITLVFSILLLFLGTLLINIKNNTLTNEAFIPAGILSVIFIVVQIISVRLRKNADNYLLSPAPPPPGTYPAGLTSAARVQPRGCKGRSPLHKKTKNLPLPRRGRGSGGWGQKSKLKAG